MVGKKAIDTKIKYKLHVQTNHPEVASAGKKAFETDAMRSKSDSS